MPENQDKPACMKRFALTTVVRRRTSWLLLVAAAFGVILAVLLLPETYPGVHIGKRKPRQCAASSPPRDPAEAWVRGAEMRKALTEAMRLLGLKHVDFPRMSVVEPTVEGCGRTS